MTEMLKIGLPVPKEGAATRFAHYFDALLGLGAQPGAVGPEDDPADYDGLLLPGGVAVTPSMRWVGNAISMSSSAAKSLGLLMK